MRRLPDRPLTVREPDGSLLVAGIEGGPELHVRRDAFYHRLGAAGKIGFGEAYMAGEWTAAGDLASVLRPFAANLEGLVPPLLQHGRRLFEPRQPRAERNTIRGASGNIRRHYDLSNELFSLFLDETMTYSCAIFTPGDSLAEAQSRKYRAMADLAGVRPGDRVLEIGTGWGGMAIHLASVFGCRVTTVTVSEEQAMLARRRVALAGVGDLVDVRLCDYREVDGRYDRIVSIEMFEAVGERYWPDFFAACDARLAPGGRMAMQTITMPHSRFLASRHSYGWIHKYIFPGGLIPSRRAVHEAARVGYWPAGHARGRNRPPLRDDAALVAGAVYAQPARRPRSRVRRAVRADVGVLFRLLRGRLRDHPAGRHPARPGARVNLAGKRVWVTGASRGIGRALVEELSARGALVAATARSAEQLDQLSARLPHVLALPADVTDRASMRAAARRVETEMGGIDVAVLNAGYWRQIDVTAWDSEEFRRHLETNLIGMAHGIEAVLPGMRRRRRGVIVGISSLAGLRGFPRAEAYSATKAAQITLLESLRIDLRELGIRVQTICPGFVRTDLTKANAFRMPFMLEPEEAARRIAQGIERGSPMVAFPWPMTILMNLARLAPARAYAAAWSLR